MEFINGTGFDIYGFGDDPFDFPLAEDAATAMIQVNNALNLNNPVPVGASSVGTNQFFIPALERFGFWGAFGGQNILGLWDACELECLSGITILNPNDAVTYAKFTVSGAPEIPVPAAVWLFGSGLLGLVGMARRKKV